MKYKVKSTSGKNALERIRIDEYDWILWYGSDLDDFYQVQSLIRYVPTDKAHANCISENNEYLRAEQLTFQSKKAALRYILKHKDYIQNDYMTRNAGKRCSCVIAEKWIGKSKLVVVKI